MTVQPITARIVRGIFSFFDGLLIQESGGVVAFFSFFDGLLIQESGGVGAFFLF